MLLSFQTHCKIALVIKIPKTVSQIVNPVIWRAFWNGMPTTKHTPASPPFALASELECGGREGKPCYWRSKLIVEWRS